MTFVCTAPSPPYQFSVSNDGNKIAIDFRVGYDDAIDVDYLALVGLGGAPDGMEYYFCIIKVDGDDRRETRIWHSVDLPVGCTKHHRSAILSAILAATDKLLRSVMPRLVSRVIEANLPAKALVKHEAVSQIFTSCGYRLTGDRIGGLYRAYVWER
jgi:hypothetical protein